MEYLGIFRALLIVTALICISIGVVGLFRPSCYCFSKSYSKSNEPGRYWQAVCGSILTGFFILYLVMHEL